jgi:hypothetical protein
MAQVHVGVGGGAGVPAVCPDCDGPLTEGAVCWRCCDRLCGACGQPTGSAFISLCWPCSYRADAEKGGAVPSGCGK